MAGRSYDVIVVGGEFLATVNLDNDQSELEIVLQDRRLKPGSTPLTRDLDFDGDVDGRFAAQVLENRVRGAAATARRDRPDLPMGRVDERDPGRSEN